MNKFKYCPIIEVGDVFTRVEVDTDDYYILVKEEYSRFHRYKHQYFLHKATDKSVGE